MEQLPLFLSDKMRMDYDGRVRNHLVYYKIDFNRDRGDARRVQLIYWHMPRSNP